MDGWMDGWISQLQKILPQPPPHMRHSSLSTARSTFFPSTHLSVAAAQNPAPAATHTMFSPSAICTVHMALLDQESNGLRVGMGEEDIDEDLNPSLYDPPRLGHMWNIPPHTWGT